MSAADTHAILIRPLATSRWGILEYATSAESALAKASGQRGGLSRGDLILAIDLVEISAIEERGECLYFVNKTGKVKQAPQPLGHATWFLAWEGPDAMANKMLFVCDKIDRKLLVTVACAIARLALPYVPAGEHRPRIAIEMAEAWVRGEAALEQVKNASKDAAPNDPDDASPYAYATDAASSAASAVSDAYYAHRTAYYTAPAMPGNYNENLRQLSHIVREYIPLHAVLESLV